MTKWMSLCLNALLLLTVSAGSQAATTPNPLHISAFKDIASFILETAKKEYNLDIDIKYVKDALEAHRDLMDKKADLVFMSYDDTLSIAIQDGYSDIAAIMPIHGGILDLCGKIDLTKSTILTGIDTTTGYARLLKLYLSTKYPDAKNYGKFKWILAGATNVRYDKLKDHLLDTTLLNPPYSYEYGAPKIVSMYDFIGKYAGAVVNVNKSRLQNAAYRKRLDSFMTAYSRRVQEMKSHPDQTIAELVTFYKITLPVATLIYNRLWMPDGLSKNREFDEEALKNTESIFSHDTGIAIPKNRTWITKIE